MSLRERLESVEREALESALRTAGGNRAKAARLLSTTERIFNYRVRKYGIDWRTFRKGSVRFQGESGYFKNGSGYFKNATGYFKNESGC